MDAALSEFAWSCVDHSAFQDAIKIGEFLFNEAKAHSAIVPQDQNLSHLSSAALLSSLNTPISKPALPNGLIQSSLSDNAIEALWLLANCYYRSGRIPEARQLLTSRIGPNGWATTRNASPSSSRLKCRLLHAQCLFDLSKLKEASNVLLSGLETAGEHMPPPQTLSGCYLSIEVQILEQVVRDSQQAPFAFLLLGRIYSKLGSRSVAIEAFNKCLALQPLLISAFVELSILGYDQDPHSIYKSTPELFEKFEQYIPAISNGGFFRTENHSAFRGWRDPLRQAMNSTASGSASTPMPEGARGNSSSEESPSVSSPPLAPVGDSEARSFAQKRQFSSPSQVFPVPSLFEAVINSSTPQAARAGTLPHDVGDMLCHTTTPIARETLATALEPAAPADQHMEDADAVDVLLSDEAPVTLPGTPGKQVPPLVVVSLADCGSSPPMKHAKCSSGSGSGASPSASPRFRLGSRFSSDTGSAVLTRSKAGTLRPDSASVLSEPVVAASVRLGSTPIAASLAVRDVLRAPKKKQAINRNPPSSRPASRPASAYLGTPPAGETSSIASEPPALSGARSRSTATTNSSSAQVSGAAKRHVVAATRRPRTSSKSASVKHSASGASTSSNVQQAQASGHSASSSTASSAASTRSNSAASRPSRTAATKKARLQSSAASNVFTTSTVTALSSISSLPAVPSPISTRAAHSESTENLFKSTSSNPVSASEISSSDDKFVVPKVPVAQIASATTSSTIAIMSVQPNACPTGELGSSSAVAVARSHLAEAGVDASAFEASAHPETGLRRPLQQSQAAFAKSTSSARFGAHVAPGLSASGEQLSHSGTVSSTSSKATVLMRTSEDNWPSRSHKYFEMLLQQRKSFLELVLDHYSKCATALKAIHLTGELPGAVELLREKIAKNQELSGWTLSLLGRCFFEMGRFKEAAQSFARQRKEAPECVAEFEYYSSALYNMHVAPYSSVVALAESPSFSMEPTQTDSPSLLAELAQDLEARDLDARVPYFCVLGNLYSRLGDQERSLKAFQRARQMDPTNPYIHFLIGFELVNKKCLEAAEDSFNKALSFDDRHYLSWRGLGIRYLHEEKYNMAINYLKKALLIRPKDVFSWCFLAQAQQSCRDLQSALESTQHAIDLEWAIALAAPAPAPSFAHKPLAPVAAGRYTGTASVADLLAPPAPAFGGIGPSFKGLAASTTSPPNSALRCDSMARPSLGRLTSIHTAQILCSLKVRHISLLVALNKLEEAKRVLEELQSTRVVNEVLLNQMRSLVERAAGDSVTASIYEYASKFPDASSAGKWMDRATEAGELLLPNADSGASSGAPHTPSALGAGSHSSALN